MVMPEFRHRQSMTPQSIAPRHTGQGKTEDKKSQKIGHHNKSDSPPCKAEPITRNDKGHIVRHLLPPCIRDTADICRLTRILHYFAHRPRPHEDSHTCAGMLKQKKTCRSRFFQASGDYAKRTAPWAITNSSLVGMTNALAESA